MALTLAVTLLGLVLEDHDLLALAVLHHGSGHLGALHHGSAHGDLLAVDDSQHLVKGHVVAGLVGQLLDEEGIALSHLVLLTTGLDDCVHYVFNSFITGSLSGAGTRFHLQTHSKRL